MPYRTLVSHQPQYETVVQIGADAYAPASASRSQPWMGLAMASAVCGVVLCIYQFQATSGAPTATWVAQPASTQARGDLSLQARRFPVLADAKKAAGAALVASSVLTSGAGVAGAAVSGPAMSYYSQETSEERNIRKSEFDTSVLAPELAQDAPPLVAGEDYIADLDADYEPGDSFDNILGLVVKVTIFAPLAAFLAVFLFGFVSNDDEMDAEVAEAEEAARVIKSQSILMPVAKPPPPILEPEEEEAPASIQEKKIIAYEDVAMASEDIEHVAVYFRPIPEDVGFAETLRLFTTFGNVECMQLKDDYGFVWMNEKAATSAIAVLHGGEFKNTRMYVGMANTNKLPAAQRQLIFRQCQLEFERIERAENRAVSYFRGLAKTAATAARLIDAADKSQYAQAIKELTCTLEDINSHHVLDIVDARGTAQVGLEQLMQLSTALKDAKDDDVRQQAAIMILNCITKYDDLEVIPLNMPNADSSTDGKMALYFRPVPQGASTAAYAQLFDKYGQVDCVQLKEGYGFVWMEESGARAALELLPGHRVPGGKLYLSEAKTNGFSAEARQKYLETCQIGPSEPLPTPPLPVLIPLVNEDKPAPPKEPKAPVAVAEKKEPILPDGLKRPVRK